MCYLGLQLLAVKIIRLALLQDVGRELLELLNRDSHVLGCHDIHVFVVLHEEEEVRVRLGVSLGGGVPCP